MPASGRRALRPPGLFLKFCICIIFVLFGLTAGKDRRRLYLRQINSTDPSVLIMNSRFFPVGYFADPLHGGVDPWEKKGCPMSDSPCLLR